MTSTTCSDGGISSPATIRTMRWTTDGLSRTERRLLQLAASGPIELLAAFPSMHEGETAYYITDRSFLSLVTELSSGTEPLLAVTGESLRADRIPHAALTITE